MLRSYKIKPIYIYYRNYFIIAPFQSKTIFSKTKWPKLKVRVYSDRTQCSLLEYNFIFNFCRDLERERRTAREHTFWCETENLEVTFVWDLNKTLKDLNLQLVLTEKGFMGRRKTRILYEGKGVIRNIKWMNDLIAWSDEKVNFRKAKRESSLFTPENDFFSFKGSKSV